MRHASRTAQARRCVFMDYIAIKGLDRSCDEVANRTSSVLVPAWTIDCFRFGYFATFAA
jgi:hypothetical protein